MAQKLNAPLPAQLTLSSGYTLAFAAVDPSTGAEVGGVTVSGAYLIVTQLTPGGPAELLSVTPLWVPLPLEGES